jgi:hypothetical protein
VRELLTLPTVVTATVAASRLLERLDARLAREHPVDLEFHGPVAVATVPLGDDDAGRVVLERGVVTITDDVDHRALSVDDAEALAYALLRLVAVARDPAPEEQT